MDATAYNSEEQSVHTRLLRLALGVEESRDYWININPKARVDSRTTNAFEQRWFGAKSEQRVRVLLSNFRVRYDRFPEALSVLHNWSKMDPSTRRAICHWHLQLADPLYRAFTSEFLPRRREMSEPAFDRDVVIRWVNNTYPGRWGSSTNIQFGSKLLSAASEAGVITPTRDPRTLLYPKISDHALGYLLYLLRAVDFTGTLTSNPYLNSVGIDPIILQQRLQNVPGINYQRMIDLDDFGWQYPSLTTWAEGTV